MNKQKFEKICVKGGSLRNAWCGWGKKTLNPILLSRAIDCWCEHRGGGKEEID